MKFIAKMLVNGLLLTLMLYGFTETSMLAAAAVAILFVIVAWLVGDQLILRATNNTIATLADAGLALIYLWMVAAVLDWNLSFGEMLIISAAVGIVEWFFHRYALEREAIPS